MRGRLIHCVIGCHPSTMSMTTLLSFIQWKCLLATLYTYDISPLLNLKNGNQLCSLWNDMQDRIWIWYSVILACWTTVCSYYWRSHFFVYNLWSLMICTKKCAPLWTVNHSIPSCSSNIFLLCSHISWKVITYENYNILINILTVLSHGILPYKLW